MNTSMGSRFRPFIAMPVGDKLTWAGTALLVLALLSPSSQLSDTNLEALDPALMKAVQASVSQRDVQAILSQRRASGPVQIQLYTSCDQVQRCTIFTNMDFPRSASQPRGLSLQVAMLVVPDGITRRTVTSAWQVRAIGPAIDEHVHYAGDFSGLSVLARNSEGMAMAGVLTSIQSAVATVLVAHGVAAKPDPIARIVAAA